MSETAPSVHDDTLDIEAKRLFAQLGVRPLINCMGAYTTMGGSYLSPAVRAAMETANHRFADMPSLLDSSGRLVAEMLDTEAAYITSGAAAALTLAVAACLTKDHRDYLERLPDTSGIPNEIVVQKNTRQKYDRCLIIPGARLVEAGDADGVTPAQLRDAIGPNTIAVHYLAATGAPGTGIGTPPVEAVIEVAHERGVPVIVDAAGLTYPVDNLRKYARLGADLVCYAAKYFDAPQSTGLLVGRKELVDVAAINGYVGFETSGYRTLGRPMKVDRQEIFGCVVALQEWLAMNHEARFAVYAERTDVIMRALSDIEGVEAVRISEKETATPMVRDGVRLRLESHQRAESAVMALREGEPCIWARVDDRLPDSIYLTVAYLHDGDAELIARRLREVLGA